VPALAQQAALIVSAASTGALISLWYAVASAGTKAITTAGTVVADTLVHVTFAVIQVLESITDTVMAIGSATKVSIWTVTFAFIGCTIVMMIHIIKDKMWATLWLQSRIGHIQVEEIPDRPVGPADGLGITLCPIFVPFVGCSVYREASLIQVFGKSDGNLLLAIMKVLKPMQVGARAVRDQLTAAQNQLELESCLQQHDLSIEWWNAAASTWYSDACKELTDAQLPPAGLCRHAGPCRPAGLHVAVVESRRPPLSAGLFELR